MAVLQYNNYMYSIPDEDAFQCSLDDNYLRNYIELYELQPLGGPLSDDFVVPSPVIDRVWETRFNTSLREDHEAMYSISDTEEQVEVPTTVGDILGMGLPKGLKNIPSDELVIPDSYIGLEVETNFGNVIQTNLITSVNEGSLQQPGYEYIFRYPLFGVDVLDALSTIQDNVQPLVDRRGAHIVYDSNTSTHIHIDTRDMTAEQLASFIMYYTLFEKIIFKAFAKEREDNNFCVPIYKAFGHLRAVTSLYHSLRNDQIDFRHTGRYGAMNLEALDNFGSIEFRLFRGEWRKEVLLMWINTLLSLKKVAIEGGENAMKPYVTLKGRALHPFLTSIFPEGIVNKLMYKGVYHDLKAGIKSARYIANSREFNAGTRLIDNYRQRLIAAEHLREMQEEG